MKEKKEEVGFGVNLNFVESFNLGLSFNYTSSMSTSEYNSYKSSVLKTVVKAIGGEYVAGMSAQQWAPTLRNNLVPLDREADMVNVLFVASNFPEFSFPIVKRANDFVLDAIEQYLGANVIEG